MKLIKKMNLWPPGWRFFSSPAFPETRVYFFLDLQEVNAVKLSN